MILHVALGIGAGLVSALLFAAVASNALPAILLMYLAPLPILIVGLGWHRLVALLALAVGALTVSLALRSSAGLAFALGPALSGWALSSLALLARPVHGGAANDETGSGLRWLPVGFLLLAVGVAGAAIGLSSLVATTGADFERYREALEGAAGSLLRREAGVGRSGPLPQTLGVPGREFVDAVVWLAPALLGSMLTLILAANLWLAGKAVAISGRLPRPWPDIPAVRMPRVAAAFLLAAFLLAQAGGFPGVTGMALLGGLTTAFSLQGLAVLHFLTRSRPGRPVILMVAYGLTFILSYVFLPAFALLGIADSLAALRRPPGGSPPRSFT